MMKMEIIFWVVISGLGVVIFLRGVVGLMELRKPKSIFGSEKAGYKYNMAIPEYSPLDTVVAASPGRLEIHPTDYHGLRNLEDWTDETTCIHCGEPIVKNRGWCHLTFRSDSSGYTNCKAHKNRIYLDSDGGTSAEPDKKLFPDPPPHVYKHKIEISEPIYYDSLEDDTHITFSKDFKGEGAIIVKMDSTGMLFLSKQILLDQVPAGVSWWIVSQ